jgi:sialate O-acetylesterase
MQHPISGWEWIPNSAILEAYKVLEEAKGADIRLFSISIFPSPVPLSNLPDGQWERANANSLAQFSATAWFFAKKLNQELDIPIGIIHSSWGGTSILAWTNQEALDDFKDSLRLPPSPDNIDWKQQVEASVENQRIRRNAISYPNAGVLQRITSAQGKSENWQKVILPDESTDLAFVSWLQKEVVLEKNQANRDLTLHLGFLNRQSHVYWNDTLLGYFQYPAPVKASVPASLVKEGVSTITLRVASPAGSGKVQGDKEEFYLEGNLAESTHSLAGEWNLLEKVEPIPEVLPSYVNLPSFLFNGMVAPVIPYGIKGFIWDQGSADASRPLLYAQLFKRLITNWRGFWHNDRLPFLFVQNTGTYVTHQFDERSFKRSYLREAQQDALDLPETGMVVTVDLGDPYDVHPKNKQDFGNRLALQALRKVYGKPIVADGPFLGTFELRGDTLVVQASELNQQLVLKIKDGLTGFEIAGTSGDFFPATVRLQGNALYIHSPAIHQPEILRYAWGDNPDISVFNNHDLPMAPFRVVVNR